MKYKRKNQTKINQFLSLENVENRRIKCVIFWCNKYKRSYYVQSIFSVQD